MDQHEVEFQRFLQKMEFSDVIWKQLVAQKIQHNTNIFEQDQLPPRFSHWGLERRLDLPRDPQ